MSAPKKDGQPDFQGLIFIWFSSDFWQKKAQNAFPSESQVLRRTESHPIPFYYSILRIAGRNCFWEENSKYSNDNDNGRSFLNQSKVSLSPNFAQSEFDKCSASGRGRVPLSSEDQFEEQSICLANILFDPNLCFLKFVALFYYFWIVHFRKCGLELICLLAKGWKPLCFGSTGFRGKSCSASK